MTIGNRINICEREVGKHTFIPNPYSKSTYEYIEHAIRMGIRQCRTGASIVENVEKECKNVRENILEAVGYSSQWVACRNDMTTDVIEIYFSSLSVFRCFL